MSASPLLSELLLSHEKTVESTVVECFSLNDSDSFGDGDGTEKNAAIKGGVADYSDCGWNNGVLATGNQCSRGSLDDGVAGFT